MLIECLLSIVANYHDKVCHIIAGDNGAIVAETGVRVQLGLGI